MTVSETARRQMTEELARDLEQIAAVVEMLNFNGLASPAQTVARLRQAADAITAQEAEIAELLNGKRAIIPHTKAHAENLYTIAVACLKTYGVDT